MADFPWLRSDPLAQVPSEKLTGFEGESDEAHAALVDYATMGPGRSLRKLHAQYVGQSSTGTQPPTTSLASIKTWCAKYAWVARVKAKKVEQDRKAETDWDARREDFRERAWEDADQLGGLFQKIMDESPKFLTTRTVSQGRPTKVGPNGEVLEAGEPRVVILALSINDMVRVRDLARKLGNEAVGGLDVDEAIRLVIEDRRSGKRIGGLGADDF